MRRINGTINYAILNDINLDNILKYCYNETNACNSRKKEYENRQAKGALLQALNDY